MARHEHVKPARWEDLGSIEADIEAMEDVARALAAEVTQGFAPQFDRVAARMNAGLPAADEAFGELAGFLRRHADARARTVANTAGFGAATTRAAWAAHEVSESYRGSDAFAHARVSDVTRAFEDAGAAVGAGPGAPATDPARIAEALAGGDDPSGVSRVTDGRADTPSPSGDDGADAGGVPGSAGAGTGAAPGGAGADTGAASGGAGVGTRAASGGAGMPGR